VQDAKAKGQKPPWGLGPANKEKMIDFLNNGILARNKVFENDEGCQVRVQLEMCHGIGSATARKLYNSGARRVYSATLLM